MKWDKKAQSYYRLHTDRVDKEKAMDGVSPNVIHCQDSCHLLMTTLACKDEGLTDIMVVHDSFATTIADTEKLSWRRGSSSSTSTTATASTRTSSNRQSKSTPIRQRELADDPAKG